MTEPRKTTLSVRLDADVKARAEAVLVAAGLTPTNVVRGIFAYIARNQRLPVDLLQGIEPPDLERSRQELSQRRRRYDSNPDTD